VEIARSESLLGPYRGVQAPVKVQSPRHYSTSLRVLAGKDGLVGVADVNATAPSTRARQYSLRGGRPPRCGFAAILQVFVSR
jgi:hypothetical protein